MQTSVENTNIPAFLGKLWKMVEDPATDQLICWSPAGNSFIIQNQAQFWYELLPLYYKHNNMSSFVRQLNMYGFHKISTVENGSMDADKDEIQFYHPYFQKDQPEKLALIKRKVTIAKSHDNPGIYRQEDLSKVLTDVKQLRGRQASVDSQLSAMKQENAVLWRELALLRQKHIKQQQIVNKLIQFLVTLVQPTASARMGVGAKRRMPLMLHEGAKKVKARKNSHSQSDAGPTIFELENEAEVSPEQIFEQDVEEEAPIVNSPMNPANSVPSETFSKVANSPIVDESLQNETENQDSTNVNFWDKPEFVDLDDANDDFSNTEEHLMNTLSHNVELNGEPSGKVFINPSNRDTLISNLTSGAYSTNVLGGKSATIGKKQGNTKQICNAQSRSSMQVATKNNKAKIDTTHTQDEIREQFEQNLDTAQNELDQLKDILSGCSSFDATALLGLFTDNDPDCGIRSTLQNKENTTGEATDPLVSGNELTPANNLLDFNELFDDSLNGEDNNLATDSDLLSSSEILTPQSTSLDTPLIVKNEPVFPSST